MKARCFPGCSPVGIAYRGPETGGGFYWKHYSEQFGQPSGGPVGRLAWSYMLGSHSSHLEPFCACPSLLKRCFCALYICEFLETPPTLLSLLANEPALFYLSLLALSCWSRLPGLLVLPSAP